ncbi:MAG: TonB C-terminal domain-containing protein [Deltaproteobacteria bacterium]|jgi:protein TonB|nr:TonB C-terminal domain-containing protein [Deltaproteobacteria bacterium]
MFPELKYTDIYDPRSITGSFLLHAGAVLFLLIVGAEGAERNWTPLAVMDLAYYDPLGGNPGGLGQGTPEEGPVDQPATSPLPTPPPEIFEPEPEPMAVPEDMFPSFIESSSEEAVPIAPPPPPEVVEKPKPKPKPKPKIVPVSVPAVSPNLAAEGQAGSENVGGGPGGGAGGGPGDGQGGLGGGTGRGNPRVLDAYVSKIRVRLDRNKKYPTEAIAKNLRGIVEINFTIAQNGMVSRPRIVHSSGHSSLDDEVVALVQRVSPLPPIPTEINRTSLNLTVPVQFARR